ncbi:GlcG/HbpS family heme-binding protein [Magnetococcus sp. PR-3]|uniref:GlcG/HbpS family heme-binding protein n=1 Tax=Magnetococcus sp. PR-3 TaxID=3120355 RepID=UPI002FCE55BE
MKKQFFLILALMVCLVHSPAQAEEEMAAVVPLQKMSLQTANSIAQQVIEACRQKGIQIGVTVMDRDGIPQAILRDTVAPPITLTISKGKAYAAAMFRVPTSQLKDRAQTAIGRVPGVVMSAGAIPLEVGGIFLGSVGVSGAPSGETDEACAEEGAQVVLDELEMSMM